MDPVMENDPRNEGLSRGEKKIKGGLFIYDKGIDLLDVQPLKSKEAVSMGKAVRQHKGRRTLKNVYSDNRPSLIEELSTMRINHDLSEPGVPETNGLMESMVKILIGATRTKLEVGGAPICFYIHAAMHYCMMRNILSGAWKRMHGHDFPGLRIPFFSKVTYMPSPIYQRATQRYEPPTRVGVFVGWVLNSGLNWRKATYRVIDLADFIGCNLHRRARCQHLKVHFQEVSKIEGWDENSTPVYPLKDQYEWFNSTFHGCLTAMAMDPVIFEKKKDRKGRLAYDQGLDKVVKEPVSEEEKQRRDRKQARKVRYFAQALGEYDLQEEVDDYLRGRKSGQWEKRIPKVLETAPFDSAGGGSRHD